MIGLLKSFADDFFMPELDWLQVEVTSFCNARCFYCPHEIHRVAWQNQHMELRVFEKLLPVLRSARLAYLQGWGEPFMHPDFFNLVTMAKKAGCRVGATTNGTLIKAERARAIVANGMDLVSFSLAGASPQNDFYRRGTTLTGVLRGIEELAAARERSGSAAPDIHISYLLLRSGVNELKRLPDLLAGAAVSEVVISTLDFIPDESLASEAITPDNPEKLAEVRNLLTETANRGNEKGVKISYRLPGDPVIRKPCTENPLKAAFISAEGRVSPCVFNSIPVGAGPGAESPSAVPHQKSFGALDKDSFSSIWRKKDYVKFRTDLFASRVGERCLSCMKLSI